MTIAQIITLYRLFAVSDHELRKKGVWSICYFSFPEYTYVVNFDFDILVPRVFSYLGVLAYTQKQTWCMVFPVPSPFSAKGKGVIHLSASVDYGGLDYKHRLLVKVTCCAHPLLLCCWYPLRRKQTGSCCCFQGYFLPHCSVGHPELAAGLPV